jgi:hypothetical protein
MLLMLAACRGRTSPTLAAAWKPGPAEHAALLVLDHDGNTKLVCVPGPAPARPLFPEFALGQLLDVAWKDGPRAAGWTRQRSAPDPGSGGELVLLTTTAEPRRVAKPVRAARFSPDGAALAYEVAGRDDSTGLDRPTSYVLDLATGNTTELGGMADPRWEADGKGLRGTTLRGPGQPAGSATARWASLRVRWDRTSGATTVLGPGSAQLPAPVGTAVAWSEVSRGTLARGPCSVVLRPLGGVRHSVVGEFCLGMADDRGVRWSADGQWLAFAHPGPVPGDRNPGTFFVDVVGIAGGRYPALSDLDTRVGPAALPITTAPGPMWFDWSPSQRFLAVQDGADTLQVYDFQAQGIVSLGKGRSPLWSPGGGYLLLLADGPAAVTDGASATHAFALPGVEPAARMDLGPARDARWLPPQACPK